MPTYSWRVQPRRRSGQPEVATVRGFRGVVCSSKATGGDRSFKIDCWNVSCSPGDPQQEVPDRIPPAMPEFRVNVGAPAARQQIIISRRLAVELRPVQQADPGNLRQDPGGEHGGVSLEVRLPVSERGTITGNQGDHARRGMAPDPLHELRIPHRAIVTVRRTQRRPTRCASAPPPRPEVGMSATYPMPADEPDSFCRLQSLAAHEPQRSGVACVFGGQLGDLFSTLVVPGLLPQPGQGPRRPRCHRRRISPGPAVQHSACPRSSPVTWPGRCTEAAEPVPVRKSNRYRPAGPPTASALVLSHVEAATLLSSRIRARARPVATSQTRTVLSSPPEASQLPSGATATALTQPVWPVRAARSRPVPRPRSAPSRPRRRWPASCHPAPPPSPHPAGVAGQAARCCPVATSQIRTVPSSPPVASQLPSGATATAVT